MARQTTADAIREACIEQGLNFKPWEPHPADVDEPTSPYPSGSPYSAAWPKAWRLRQRLLKEVRAKRRTR